MRGGVRVLQGTVESKHPSVCVWGELPMIMESRNSSLALIWWRVDILASSSTIFWLNRRHESQPGEQLRGGIV